MRSTGNSYSRTREIVSQAFVELGYKENLFGLHSLRAGSASAAAKQALAIGFLTFMEGGNRLSLSLSLMTLFTNAQQKKYIYIYI